MNILVARSSPSCESRIKSHESSSHGKGVGHGVVDAGSAPGEDGGFAQDGGVFGVGAADSRGFQAKAEWGAVCSVQFVAEKGGR